MRETRTRLWEGEHTSTAVQFRTDAEPMVWLHTALGWIPIKSTPPTEDRAEWLAATLAKSYRLLEATPARALYMLGEAG